MPIIIRLADPRAQLVRGIALGCRGEVVRGDHDRPVPALLIAKPRGGTAAAWTEVVNHG